MPFLQAQTGNPEYKIVRTIRLDKTTHPIFVSVAEFEPGADTKFKPNTFKAPGIEPTK